MDTCRLKKKQTEGKVLQTSVSPQLSHEVLIETAVLVRCRSLKAGRRLPFQEVLLPAEPSEGIRKAVHTVCVFRVNRVHVVCSEQTKAAMKLQNPSQSNTLRNL